MQNGFDSELEAAVKARNEAFRSFHADIPLRETVRTKKILND